jgi:hypothetical protein
VDGVKTESVHVISWPMLTLFSNNIQFYVVHATIASLQPCMWRGCKQFIDTFMFMTKPTYVSINYSICLNILDLYNIICTQRSVCVIGLDF